MCGVIPPFAFPIPHSLFRQRDRVSCGLLGFRDGCPLGRGIENAGLQDCGLRSADLFSCGGVIPHFRIPYSAFPTQAARSGILRASGRFVMAVR